MDYRKQYISIFLLYWSVVQNEDMLICSIFWCKKSEILEVNSFYNWWTMGFQKLGWGWGWGWGCKWRFTALNAFQYQVLEKCWTSAEVLWYFVNYKVSFLLVISGFALPPFAIEKPSGTRTLARKAPVIHAIPTPNKTLPVTVNGMSE